MKRAPLALPPLIAKKRDGGQLDDGEIQAVVAGAARGDIPDYQLSALLMAIVWRGMTTRELTTWTVAMIDSGDGCAGPRCARPPSTSTRPAASATRSRSRWRRSARRAA